MRISDWSSDVCSSDRAGRLVRHARTLRRRRSGLTASTVSWSGSIMLGAGWALIDARIGSSRPHSHVAHQISLAVERDLEISGDADMLVPAGHAIEIGRESCMEQVVQYV